MYFQSYYGNSILSPYVMSWMGFQPPQIEQNLYLCTIDLACIVEKSNIVTVNSITNKVKGGYADVYKGSKKGCKEGDKRYTDAEYAEIV